MGYEKYCQADDGSRWKVRIRAHNSINISLIFGSNFKSGELLKKVYFVQNKLTIKFNTLMKSNNKTPS